GPLQVGAGRGEGQATLSLSDRECLRRRVLPGGVFISGRHWRKVGGHLVLPHLGRPGIFAPRAAAKRSAGRRAIWSIESMNDVGVSASRARSPEAVPAATTLPRQAGMAQRTYGAAVASARLH